MLATTNTSTGCGTLGYSKSPEMHDRIIGTFIERESCF
ncbi:hypothetical protein YPPY13_3913 [Yersinia pestis PY-13]|nr:hypothetical protein YPPY03_3956 [Yersinia pestis PY-03]EIQ99430.1 hypothetical protein YPPY05_3874 [Yersinia pestis PY-05]EIR02982.1 hypothetical protein YPPY06_3933 [Yersinia pestis PY-06]EIR42401.1 hypothetical protein YPPY13_3913 [Yersinia pestis PY-13]EIR56919.1 hypothetical protein YPPY16_3913 [Yersinia pestis PY-16]EIR61422.1 hypothetical protein YPPY25_3927 [Yersinia pestis PY-25]EIR72411.1 hypothetical protein YPPY34_3905 [Yersinia pestis PY-34]EIR84343.1 hypothetical protein YPP